MEGSITQRFAPVNLGLGPRVPIERWSMVAGPDGADEPLDEDFGIERLRQKANSACTECRPSRTLLGDPGDEDDGYFPTVRLETTLQLDAAQTGQFDVENQTGRLVGVFRFQKILGRGELRNGETERAHESSGRLARKCIIVDNRDQGVLHVSGLPSDDVPCSPRSNGVVCAIARFGASYT